MDIFGLFNAFKEVLDGNYRTGKFIRLKVRSHGDY